jgi:hypothetical protein
MPYDLLGNYFEYPKGQRKAGLTDAIREGFARHFPNVQFTVRLVGWGNKRGHLLYEIAWDITQYTDGGEWPSERHVEIHIRETDRGGWIEGGIRFVLKPRKKTDSEERGGLWPFFANE